MNRFKKEITAGFTLIELILVIAIIAIMATIAALSFSGFHSGQAVPNTVNEATALLNEARSRTLAGDSGNQYGVHIQSDRVVLFTGTSYSSTSTTNKVILNDSTVTSASTTLQGGGSEVIFNKLTGETSDYGYFVVKQNSSTKIQKTITISQTGLVSSN